MQKKILQEKEDDAYLSIAINIFLLFFWKKVEAADE